MSDCLFSIDLFLMGKWISAEDALEATDLPMLSGSDGWVCHAEMMRYCGVEDLDNRLVHFYILSGEEEMDQPKHIVKCRYEIDGITILSGLVKQASLVSYGKWIEGNFHSMFDTLHEAMWLSTVEAGGVFYLGVTPFNEDEVAEFWVKADEKGIIV